MRTKHIELDYHFVREKVAAKELQVQFVSTKDQIADVFTKSMSATRLGFLRDKLTLSALGGSTCGGVSDEVKT